MSKPLLILLAVLFLTVSVVVGETQLSIGITASIISSPTYIVTIVMENHPLIYYADVQDNVTRCSSHVVPANSGPSGPPDDLFISDLNNLTTASNFMWLTPNNCDDMHGGNGCPSSIMTFADNYTRQLVPKILSSLVFKTGKAALFIVWDEPTSCGVACQIPAIWVGPTIKQHYVSDKPYNHYSYLATLESLWALPVLTPNDANAPSMIEFFL